MAKGQQGTDRQRELIGPQISVKLYRCRKCKGEFRTDTNHFGPIYICKSQNNWGVCLNGPSDCRELDFDILIKKLEQELEE